jgi:GH18 family chitinase
MARGQPWLRIAGAVLLALRTGAASPVVLDNHPRAVAAATHAAPSGRARGRVIIAYLFPKDAVADPAAIAADKLTHVNYAFANVADGRVVADPDQSSADRAVREFLAAGVPPGKLVLGVPFYGRAWAEVESDDAAGGLFRTGKKPSEPLDTRYANLSALVAGGGYERRWDRVSQASYLWSREHLSGR